jgi:pimeloyl-ACP methyl ester carboxylesterase
MKSTPQSPNALRQSRPHSLTVAEGMATWTTGIRPVFDGLADDREVITFNNAGISSSTGEVPKTVAGMAKNAEAFIDALGLKKVDLLGFSIGGMVAQQITLDRPELVRKLVLVGTAPRNFDAGNGQGHITPPFSGIFSGLLL